MESMKMSTDRRPRLRLRPRIHRRPRRHRLRGPSAGLHRAGDIGAAGAGEAEAIDLDHIRPDLQLILDRHAKTLDAARPGAVARRRKTGQRTTRENVDDLLDPAALSNTARWWSPPAAAATPSTS